MIWVKGAWNTKGTVQSDVILIGIILRLDTLFFCRQGILSACKI